ncbi:hypothetical protein BFR04_11960 [Gaetbulibacter sp. 4G1]|nr:hypothetical protein [Gaetbulibacter sp. 4G1]PIA82012.1 hypothetical protein BFR04_11960 [Gaetbulibacter sp. 4G1]
MSKNTTIELPNIENTDSIALFYVFNGKISINDNLTLRKKDSVIIEDEKVDINSEELSDLVLFITDKSKPYFDGGMFSRNRNK